MSGASHVFRICDVALPHRLAPGHDPTGRHSPVPMPSPVFALHRPSWTPANAQTPRPSSPRGCRMYYPKRHHRHGLHRHMQQHHTEHHHAKRSHMPCFRLSRHQAASRRPNQHQPAMAEDDARAQRDPSTESGTSPRAPDDGVADLFGLNMRTVPADQHCQRLPAR